MVQVVVKREEAHAEGSYCASLGVYGQEFSIHYVAGEVRAYGVGGQRGLPAWKVNGAAKIAREFAAERIAALGPRFAAAHVKLYSEE